MSSGRLRELRHPDLSDYLVHFTSRPRTREGLLPAIRDLAPEGRLQQILEDGRIRAFETYYAAVPVVCFTESTPVGLAYMIGQESYGPWGLVFHRETIFEHGGGPVFYLRDDEWEYRNSLPDRVKARTVKFSPGKAEWVWEREWRIPYQSGSPGFFFVPDDIVALIVGVPNWPPPIPSVEMVHGPDGDWERDLVPMRPPWLPECPRWFLDPATAALRSIT